MFRNVRGILGRSLIVRTFRRLVFGLSYFSARLVYLLKWSVQKTESDNFYYSLTEKNYYDLAAALSMVFQVPNAVFKSYFDELQGDALVRNHLGSWQASHAELRDTSLDFGRRITWYATARHLKPRLIVETGVHHGLGSVVLCAALLKNTSEGFPGKYLGTDIDPGAGSLLSGSFCSVGRVIYGDSLDSLEGVKGPIDMFINDSDHSAEYEAREYAAIQRKLSESAVVLGDNSHSSESLREWSEKNHRFFVLLREEPAGHWYPGAGVGVSIPNRPS